MRLLTVKETAEILHMTPQYVYRIARQGLLPALRLGRQVRIEEEALEQWLIAQRWAPADPPRKQVSQGHR